MIQKMEAGHDYLDGILQAIADVMNNRYKDAGMTLEVHHAFLIEGEALTLSTGDASVSQVFIAYASTKPIDKVVLLQSLMDAIDTLLSREILKRAVGDTNARN